jgi:hypothetical protein
VKPLSLRELVAEIARVTMANPRIEKEGR